MIAMEDLEYKIVAAFCGLFMGILLGTTIRYPIKMDNIKKYETLCGTNEHIAEAKIGISGSIYSIKCTNGIELKIN